MEYISHSPRETEEFAARFARLLQPGDVVAFRGSLGAGKTAFVRGMASALVPDAEVSSPTFALVNEYDGTLPLWHFDMYRITSVEDVDSTGFYDYLDMGGVLAVEWSENIEAALPDSSIFVSLEPVPGGAATDRRFTISGKEAARFEASLL